MVKATDSESIPQSNEQVKVSLDKTQSDLQQKNQIWEKEEKGTVATSR